MLPEDWPKIAFALALFAYVGWWVVQSRRNSRRAGAVLVDCGYERGSEPSWIVIGGLGFLAVLYGSMTVVLASSAVADGRRWEVMPRLLGDAAWPLVFFPFAIWTMLDRRRRVCEHGLLWYGAFVPWSSVVGWGTDAAARLWIVNSSPGADRMTLWVDAGRAAEVGAILDRRVGRREGDRALHG